MKNVILIITDTYRYDNLADRAEMPVRTPAIDRFAAERATAIEGFYTGSFPTIPHRTDVARGVLGWPHYGWQPIDKSGPNHVAALLGEQGYATQLICDCPHLFPAKFPAGFEAAFQHRGQEGDKFLLHLNDELEEIVPLAKTRYRPTYRERTLVDIHRWMNRNPTCEEETFPAKTGGTAIRWLEENYKAAPFFLWVDFFDPHEPWDPPEYLARRYDRDYEGIPMLHPNYGPASSYTDQELRNMRAHYAAEAELVDRWIGRILQKVDDLEMWDETILMITSDHGMSLGEHGRTGKSNIHPQDPRFWPIYPEIGHVPFLIAGGAVPQGQSLDLLAQPIDILPTIQELAGVGLGPEQPFDGRSFAACVLEGSLEHRDYVVSGSHLLPEDVAAVEGSKPVTPFLVTGRWGYAPVGPEGAPELYDLDVDPLASEDLAAQHEDVVTELHRLLIEHLRAHRAPDAVMDLWRSGPGVAGRSAIDYPDQTV
jgi:arylsulfatase A-like enzyme